MFKNEASAELKKEEELDGSLIEDALIESGIEYAPAGCIDLHTWYVKGYNSFNGYSGYLYYNPEPLESYFKRLRKKKANSKAK